MGNLATFLVLPNCSRFRKGRGTRDQIANIHWIIETVTGIEPASRALQADSLPTEPPEKPFLSSK